MMLETLRLRKDEPVTEAPLALDAFLEQPEASAVRIEAGEDVRRLVPVLDRVQLVEIDFPKLRDGRGFSSARILREEGYEGEIRATGDVLVDLIFFMQRCGIDSFRPNVPFDPEDAENALKRWPHVYQHAADAKGPNRRVPIWELRHGGNT